MKFRRAIPRHGSFRFARRHYCSSTFARSEPGAVKERRTASGKTTGGVLAGTFPFETGRPCYRFPNLRDLRLQTKMTTILVWMDHLGDLYSAQRVNFLGYWFVVRPMVQDFLDTDSRWHQPCGT
jgi:hypothetical protein